MIENLYEFKEKLSSQGIFFCYCGPVSQELLGELGDTLKRKMKMEEASRSTILKAFSMLVENAQNIIHYSAEKISNESLEEEINSGYGIITVGSEGEKYFVESGNMIDNEQVDHLKYYLDRVKNMNKEELKQFYKEERKKDRVATSKGAGLGFIEMAKKSTQPLEFDFKQIDAKMTFFSVKTVI